jgi:RecA-family ATPase
MNQNEISEITAMPELPEGIMNDVVTVTNNDQELPKSSILDRDIVSAYQLLNSKVEEIPCLWEPFFRQSGLGALVGSSDTGKSVFCRQLAMAIATRQESFLGHPLNLRTANVLYVSTEDDASAISQLLQRHLKDTEKVNELLKNFHFLFNFEKLPERLDTFLTENKVDLVILDSYGDLFDGKDSNSISQVREFLNKFSKIANKHNCFFLFVHHVGKRTEDKEPSKQNVLGSQGFEAKMRIVLELRKGDNLTKYLSVIKGNYLGIEYKTSSYELEFNEQTLTFNYTGNTVSFDEQGKSKRTKKQYNVDWYDVYEDDSELQSKIIIERLDTLYQMPSGTARTYITNDLVPVQGKFGYYRRPGTIIPLHDRGEGFLNQISEIKPKF